MENQQKPICPYCLKELCDIQQILSKEIAGHEERAFGLLTEIKDRLNDIQEKLKNKKYDQTN